LKIYVAPSHLLPTADATGMVSTSLPKCGDVSCRIISDGLSEEFNLFVRRTVSRRCTLRVRRTESKSLNFCWSTEQRLKLPPRYNNNTGTF